MRTLVLTAYMRPHAITSWQEGVTLAVCGKADVLEEYDEVCASPSISLKIPAVVRLRKEFSPRKKSVKFSRINVLTRDGFKCCYCGEVKAPRDLTYDHVVPRSRGGRTVWANIVSACRPCNRRKGSRLPAEAHMRMQYRPYAPSSLAMPPLYVYGALPEQWGPYLLNAIVQE